MDSVVRVLLIIIIVIFDPMGVLLIVTFNEIDHRNKQIKYHEKNKFTKDKKDIYVEQEDIKPIINEGTKENRQEEVDEYVEEVLQNMDEKDKSEKEYAKILDNIPEIKEKNEIKEKPAIDTKKDIVKKDPTKPLIYKGSDGGTRINF